MEFGLCVEMAFASDPFEDRLRKAAEAGFNKVEMWFVDSSFKGEPEELERQAGEAGVEITNTVIGSPDGSTGGGLTDPGKRDVWLNRARMSIEFTKEAGIPSTIVCTGNVVKGLSEEKMMGSVLDGLGETLNIAEDSGVTLLLEPLNTTYDHPGYWLTSSDKGADICRRLSSDRMRLLYDCYHMQIMEGDIINHIRRNIDVIGYFHSAGVPGRHELYKGEIDYPFVIAEIEKLKYGGIFGLEYSPTFDDGESVREVLRYLRG